MIFFLFTTAAIYSLDFRFDRIDSASGLAGNSVSGVIQDKRGFIWLATQDGLNRYDGMEFRLFEHEPFNPESLKHNLIQTMYYDNEADLIWLGTYRGINIFDPVTEKITHKLDLNNSEALKKLESGVITAIEKDRNGCFWVGTLDGLVFLNLNDGSSIVYNHDPENMDSIPDKTVRDILCDSSGRVWVATYNGVALYNDNGKFTAYLSIKDLPGEDSGISTAMALEEYSPDILLIGSWGGGITVFDIKREKYHNRKIKDNRVYLLKKDSKGHIWAGSWGGGLYYYENFEKLLANSYSNAVYDYKNRYSLSNDIVYSMGEDKSGLLWVGTNGGGVNKLNQRQSDYRYLYAKGTPGSISNDRFRALMVDEEEKLWIGSYNSGLYIHDPETGRLSRYLHDPDDNNSISDNTVNCIFTDSDGNIWVLTNSGLNLFNKENKTFERYFFSDGRIGKFRKNEISKNASGVRSIFYSMAEDEGGNFWIGTYTSGVIVWNRNSGVIRQFSESSPSPQQLSNNMVFSVVRDCQGLIWIGTNNGLNCYDKTTGEIKQYFHDPSDTYSLCNDSVRAIYCDSAGNLWFGTTGGGLSRLGPMHDIFYNFSTRDGLDHNTVISISEDSRNNIIAATLKGISLIERQPENKFTTVTSLSYQFGLSGIEFKGGAARDKKGNVFVSSTGEVYKLDTSFYYSNRFNPEIIITDLEIFDKSYIDYFGKNVFAEEEVVFKWKRSHMSFEFTSIDYIFPSGRKYKYMLEGFDREWIYSDSRNYASYTSIPPGYYRFRVTGTNSSGMWSTKEASVKIRIIPPFYRTPLAYILYIVSSVLLFYGIVMIIKGKEAEKQLAVVSRLRDELLNVNLKLDQQARIDILTGVSNRRHFNEIFSNLWDIYTRAHV